MKTLKEMLHLGVQTALPPSAAEDTICTLHGVQPRIDGLCARCLPDSPGRIVGGKFIPNPDRRG